MRRIHRPMVLRSAAAAAGLAYSAAVLADSPRIYWRLEESAGATSFVDASGNSKTGTAVTTNGSVTAGASSVFAAAGSKAVTFGGGNISAPASPFAGSTLLTMECTFQLSSLATDSLLMGRGLGTFGAFLRVSANGALDFGVVNTTPAQFTCTTRPGFIAANVPYHVVGSYNGTTGLMQLFVNGVRVFQQKTAGGAIRVPSDSAQAGQGISSTTACAGVVDEVTFYEAALSYAQAVSHYNALGFAASATPGPADANWANVALLFAGDYGLFDSSDNARPITPHGNVLPSTTQTKFASSAAYFDGSGDWLSLPDFSITGTCTVEFWFYGNGTNEAFARLLQTRDGDVNAGIALFMNTGASNSRLYVGLSSNGTSNDILASDTGADLGTGTWQHVAFVISGTTLSVYVAGTRVYTTTLSSTALYFNAADVMVIGGQGSTSRSLNAYIENLRITTGVARYSGASLTVPTASFPTHA